MNWKEEWPTRKYDIISADPPWDYNNQVQHGGKGAQYTSGAKSFYPTMTPRQLSELRVRDIAEKNAILYLWTTGPQLEVAIKVANVWGFTYKTVAIVWDKVLVNPGAYTMSQCEYVLACTRGSIPKPRGIRNARQLVRERRTRHSTNPIEVREIICLMHPSQKKIELFARNGGPGWDVWGKEAEEFK